MSLRLQTYFFCLLSKVPVTLLSFIPVCIDNKWEYKTSLLQSVEPLDYILCEVDIL